MQARETQQKRKNVATCPDSDIAAALAAKKSWAAIIAELHVGPGRISRIARGRGIGGSSGSGSGSSSNSSGSSDRRALDGLKFYKDMFDKFSEAITSHPEIMDYVLENEGKIKEAEDACQRS